MTGAGIGGMSALAAYEDGRVVLAYYDSNDDFIGSLELITRPGEYAFLTLNPPEGAQIRVEDFSDDGNSTTPLGTLWVR